MGKILIFMFEGMADYEVTFISHLLHADAGKEIMTIAYTDDAVEGQSGLHYQPQYTVKEVLKEDANSKFLIIVPTSLAYNWENEFIKFAPNLKYQVIVGNKAKRQELFKDVDKYNIIITTY